MNEEAKERLRFSFVNKEFKKVINDEPVELSTRLKHYCALIHKRVRTNRDFYLAISGAEGEGKSSLSIILGFLIDPNFSLEKNVLYSPNIEEMMLKMNWRKIISQGGTPPPDALPPYSVLVIDEAIKVLFKLEQWSGVQRFLKKLFALARTENKIIILNIPSFQDMGSGFRARMNNWLHVEKRGLCTIEARSKNKYATDPWSMDDNKKNYEKYTARKKYVSISDLDNIKIFSKISKNYVTAFSFPALPVSLDKRYNDLKNSFDYDSAEDEVKKVDLKLRGDYEKLKENYASLIVHLKRNNIMSLGEISRVVGVSRARLSQIFKANGVIGD